MEISHDHGTYCLANAFTLSSAAVALGFVLSFLGAVMA